jgi:hypothetical protein
MLAGSLPDRNVFITSIRVDYRINVFGLKDVIARQVFRLNSADHPAAVMGDGAC